MVHLRLQQGLPTFIGYFQLKMLYKRLATLLLRQELYFLHLPPEDFTKSYNRPWFKEVTC